MVILKLDVVCTKCGANIKRYKTKGGMHFCNMDCKASWQRDQKPVNKEWLYQKYIVEGLSSYEIAEIVKRDPKRVYEWLVNEGIETRKRGTGWEKREGFNWHLRGEDPPFKGKHHTEEFKENKRILRLKDGHVPYLKNGKHWLKYPGAKPASWRGGISPDRQAEYSSQEWKDAVKAVWKRANAICELCGKDHRLVDKNEEKFNIHHMYPFVSYKFLRKNPDNLVLLCKKCHLFIHSKKNVDKKFILKEMILPSWLISQK